MPDQEQMTERGLAADSTVSRGAYFDLSVTKHSESASVASDWN